MKNPPSRLSEPSTRPRGLAGDFRRLSTDGAASAAELREFVGQMRGRSPQDVLGLVAGNSLMQSMAITTIATAVLLVVFTVIPYFLFDGEQAAKKSAKPTQATAATTAAPSNNSTAAPAAATPEQTAQDNQQKAVEALGIGETKTSDPSTVPLDPLDKLLDDK
jgi:hypothetical protein